MANPISGLGAYQPIQMPKTVEEFTSAAGGGVGEESLSFQKLLLESLGTTAELSQSAEGAIEASLLGEEITQVEVFSAVKKAELALRMILQIRNKLLDGFNEIKQMQI